MDNNQCREVYHRNFDFDGTQIVLKTIDTDKRMIEVALLGKKISTADTKALQSELKAFGLGDYKHDNTDRG